MAIFYISKFDIKENTLNIVTEEKLNSLDEFKIILQDRSSKTEYFYQAKVAKLNDNFTSITLNLLEVSFFNNFKNTIDMFVSMNNKKYRIKSKAVYLKANSSRYSKNIYYLDSMNTNIAVPYLTINNNLSIIFGNASNLFNHFCNIIKPPKPIYTTEDTDSKVYSLKLNELTLSNKIFFLAYYNEEKEKYESLPYTYDETSNKIYSNSMFNLNRNKNIFIQIKEKNNLLIFPLVIIKKYDEVISTNFTFTDKPIIKNHLLIEDVTFANNIMVFKIPDLLLHNSSRFEVFLKNKSHHIFSPEIIHTEQAKDSFVEIDLSKLILNYSEKITRWEIYLKIENKFYTEINRLGIYNKPVKPSYKRYFSNNYSVNNYIATPYFTIKNGLSIIIKTRNSLHKEILQPIVSVDTFKKINSLSFLTEIMLELKNVSHFSVTSLMLKYRNKAENIEYYFDV